MSSSTFPDKCRSLIVQIGGVKPSFPFFQLFSASLRLATTIIGRGGGWIQMTLKPIPCQASDFFQGAWLLEKMGGAGNNDQFLGTTKQAQCLLIEIKYNRVIATDDEQSRGLDCRQEIAG